MNYNAVTGIRTRAKGLGSPCPAARLLPQMPTKVIDNYR